MPTKDQADAVVQRIEWLKSMSYLREEGRAPEPASDTFLPWWEDLSRNEQQAVLDEEVNWTGFSEAQMLDVERRVLDGEDMEFWLDGLDVNESITPAEIEEGSLGEIDRDRLFTEWRDDAAQRPLDEKGVRYRDESDRHLDEFARRGLTEKTDKELQR